MLGTADDAMERLKLPEQIERTAPPEADPETVALGARGRAREPLRRADADEPTEPFRLGTVADEPVEPAPPEEPGHTVELEALPGGSEDPPQREHD